MKETMIFEKKSERIFSNPQKLAKECVAFANSQGGEIIIGIGDNEIEPDPSQRISASLLEDFVKRLMSLTFNVSFVDYRISHHENGGQYARILILPSLNTIATTSQGQIYIRIGDSTQPVDPQAAIHLLQEKNAFQWEIVNQKHYRLEDVNQEEIKYFLKEIRYSSRVTDFIKAKTDLEILEYFQLIEGDYLTNLGVLWLGYENQRARLNYPLTVQYIVYNEREEKIRKIDWCDNRYNPRQLLIEIEKEAGELYTFDELQDGFVRYQIPHFRREIIREIIVNAFVHKSYSILGDIYISLYSDRLTLTSPGGLPMGITVHNILHRSGGRNSNMIKIFKALGLMESEGSGYDMIYEQLCLNNKPLPELISEFDRFSVTIYSRVLSMEIATIMEEIPKTFQDLKQKEIIALGIIAQEQRISAINLSKKLQLEGEDRLRSWVSTLLVKSLIRKRGTKRATEYFLDNKFFQFFGKDMKTTLKTIEPHVLERLIIEDLSRHPNSCIGEINTRLIDIKTEDLRKNLRNLVNSGKISHTGGRKYRQYFLAYNTYKKDKKND
ncbi:MAG: putative DNA binding domain-containing protein [Candidatus Cloacimonetes bacterium]|nr:putative DNA binding domain-containing protein [Candidatus Cloacimonadota bacterium]